MALLLLGLSLGISIALLWLCVAPIKDWSVHAGDFPRRVWYELACGPLWAFVLLAVGFRPGWVQRRIERHRVEEHYDLGLARWGLQLIAPTEPPSPPPLPARPLPRDRLFGGKNPDKP